MLRVAGRLGRIADPVILAPGRPGRLGHLGLPEVADEVPAAGPLAGLCAGLAASPHPLMAVVAVDMPFASAEVMTLLMLSASLKFLNQTDSEPLLRDCEEIIKLLNGLLRSLKS